MNKGKYMVARILSFLPDKLYLTLLYWVRMGSRIKWKNPTRFTEKLQWLKVYDRKELYTKIVDKYEVKKYITEKVGEKYVVPTIGVYDSFDEIDFSKLPNKFVMKCTHNSGNVFICKEKKLFDNEYAKKVISQELKYNLYWLSREWPYRNVKPRIIIEECLEGRSEEQLSELKLFCFDGNVKMILVCQGMAHSTNGNRTNDFYNMEYKKIPVKCLNPNSKDEYVFPERIDELIAVAQTLSRGFAHLRVDSYVADDRFYIGELTLFHNSGLRKFEPEEWDERLGEWIKLPIKCEV